jgi:hypothetical protein
MKCMQVPAHGPFLPPFHRGLASQPPPPYIHLAPPSPSQLSLAPPRLTHAPPLLQFSIFPHSPLRPRFTTPPQFLTPRPPPPYSPTTLVSPSRVPPSILQRVGLYHPRSPLRPPPYTVRSTMPPPITVSPRSVARSVASEQVVQPTAPPASPDDQSTAPLISSEVSYSRFENIILIFKLCFMLV